MQTHKLESSDDEIAITAHKPAPRAAAPERPAKRRRTGSVGRVRRPTTFLDLLRVDEPRFIRALLAPVLPADLVALCSAFQTIKRFLQQASSDDIWKLSQAKMPGPSPPPRPSSMDEMNWTTLLFVRKCQHCGKATTREIDWGLRRRFCIACQSEHVKGSRYPSTLSNVSQDVLTLVPCSGTAGASAKNYWAPEIASVHRELTRLDAMVERGDRDARELRRKFVQKREDYVEEVLNLMPAGAHWQKAYKDAQVAGAGVSKTDVRRRVVARFVALGYRADDVEAQLPATFSQGIIAGSEIAWTRFAKKIQPKLDERRHILSIKVALLQEHYRQFLGVYVPDDWETLVPFGDITSIPEVRSRLKDATDDQIVALGKTLTSIVGRWRTCVEQQLLDLLPGRPADAASLRLATSVFVRGDDPMPLTYPRMLLGSNLKSDEFGPLPYATKQGPWTVDGLRHDAVAVQVVKDYCRVSGLELADATVAMLDESPMRLQCARCDEEWPLVLHWRHAIEHAHRHHVEEDQSLPVNMWRASSVATERQAQRLDEDAGVWVCSLCPAASRVSRSTVDVRTHLRERHHATEIVKGQAYRRSLAAPMQAPMSTLAMHAAFEDREDAEKAWNCRHCVHEGDQRSIIGHLKEKHAIDLQRKPISQRMQTMPPIRVPSTPRLRDTEAGFSRNPMPSSSRRADQQAPPSSSSKRSRATSIAAVSEDDIPILALKRSRTASSTRAPRISEPPEPTKVVIALYESSSSDSEDDPTSSKVRIHGRSKTGTARAESLIPAKREASEYDVPPPNAKKRAVSSSNSSVKGKKPTETIDLTFSDPPLPQDTLPRTARDSPTTSRDGLDSIPTPSEDSSSMGESNSSEDETSSSEEDAMDVSCPVDLPQLPPLAAVPQHIRFETNPAPRAPAPPSTASQLPKPPGFVCKHCKGSEHRFKHAGIMQHLAVTHGIVFPKKQTDYEFRASAADPVADTVYMCKVCHMSLRQFDWTALTAHMATRHRLVAPRTGQHYTEANPREKTPDPSLVKRQRYICRVCPAADKPRLLTLHGLKHHLFAVHGVEKMIYRQNFDKLKLPVGNIHGLPSGRIDQEKTTPSGERQRVGSYSAASNGDDGSLVRPDESGDSIVAHSSLDDDTESIDVSSLADDDSEEGEKFDDGDNESEDERDDQGGVETSDTPLTVREARSQVIAYLNASGLGPYCDVAFSCNLCPNRSSNRKSHNMPGILAHLASSRHGITRPNVPNEYEPVARRTLDKFRYECGLCDRKRQGSLEKIKRHLAIQHSLEDEDAYKVHARDTFGESAHAPSGTCGVSSAVMVEDEPFNAAIEFNPSIPPIAYDRTAKLGAKTIAREAAKEILLCDELRGISSTIACKFVCRRCARGHGKPRDYNLHSVVHHLMFTSKKRDHGVPRPQFREDYDLLPGTKPSTMYRYKCALCDTKHLAYNKNEMKEHLLVEHSMEDADIKTHSVDILKKYIQDAED